MPELETQHNCGHTLAFSLWARNAIAFVRVFARWFFGDFSGWFLAID